MELVSNCCGANPWLNNPDLERCGECLEWCEFEDLSTELTDAQRKKQIASFIWTTCNVAGSGSLVEARQKMKDRGMQHHEIEEIVGIMIGMSARHWLSLGR